MPGCAAGCRIRAGSAGTHHPMERSDDTEAPASAGRARPAGGHARLIAGPAGPAGRPRGTGPAPDRIPAPVSPTRPVRPVVPYPPGGPTDIVARVVGMKLPEQLGSRWWWRTARAGGNLGAIEVARAAPPFRPLPRTRCGPARPANPRTPRPHHAQAASPADPALDRRGRRLRPHPQDRRPSHPLHARARLCRHAVPRQSAARHHPGPAGLPFCSTRCPEAPELAIIVVGGGAAVQAVATARAWVQAAIVIASGFGEAGAKRAPPATRDGRGRARQRPAPGGPGTAVARQLRQRRHRQLLHHVHRGAAAGRAGGGDQPERRHGRHGLRPAARRASACATCTPPATRPTSPSARWHWRWRTTRTCG